MRELTDRQSFCFCYDESMQKYVLVKFLEAVAEGAEFPASAWPLHLTIIPNFSVDWEKRDLPGKISTLLATRETFSVTAAEDEHFGPHGETRVTVLNVDSKLVSLHNDLIALLEEENAVFDTPQYIKEGYRAHITIQKHARLNRGDHAVIDNVSVVDMYPLGDIRQRKLLQTIKLGSSG